VTEPADNDADFALVAQVIPIQAMNKPSGILQASCFWLNRQLPVLALRNYKGSVDPVVSLMFQSFRRIDEPKVHKTQPISLTGANSR